jgi:hypothetical protein
VAVFTPQISTFPCISNTSPSKRVVLVFPAAREMIPGAFRPDSQRFFMHARSPYRKKRMKGNKMTVVRQSRSPPQVRRSSHPAADDFSVFFGGQSGKEKRGPALARTAAARERRGKFLVVLPVKTWYNLENHVM